MKAVLGVMVVGIVFFCLFMALVAEGDMDNVTDALSEPSRVKADVSSSVQNDTGTESYGLIGETGQFFCEVPEASLWQGHVRHLPAGEYWEELLTDIEPETYQNGAYWAVPSGWVAQAMALDDESAARNFVAELLEVWRTEGVFECISPYAAPMNEGYAASVTCLLGAVRPHRRLG